MSSALLLQLVAHPSPWPPELTAVRTHHTSYPHRLCVQELPFIISTSRYMLRTMWTYILPPETGMTWIRLTNAVFTSIYKANGLTAGLPRTELLLRLALNLPHITASLRPPQPRSGSDESRTVVQMKSD